MNVIKINLFHIDLLVVLLARHPNETSQVLVGNLPNDLRHDIFALYSVVLGGCVVESRHNESILLSKVASIHSGLRGNQIVIRRASR